MTVRALTLSASAVLVTLVGLACTATEQDAGAPDSGAPDAGGPDSSLPDAGGDLTIDGGADSDSGTDGGGCGSEIDAIVRDFKGWSAGTGHTDFEITDKGIVQPDGAIYKGWNDVGCGLVLPDLVGGLPVFNATPVTAGGVSMTGIGAQRRVVVTVPSSNPTGGCWTKENATPPGDCSIGTCVAWTDFAPPAPIIQSAASFSDWYTTKEGINMELTAKIPLTPSPADPNVKIYDTNAFFPIDNQGFGNTPGQAHNFHFTTEIHLKFTYTAGQKFSFRGDDDLWIFVNNKLALDVGGSHQALLGTIDFDAQAAALGITAGSEYQMDIYHAERQTTESNFRIETNISCLVNVPPTR